MASASMDQEKLLSEMAIDIRGIFLMDYSMAMGSLYGPMGSSMKENLLIIASQGKEYISGLMEVAMRARSKMD